MWLPYLVKETAPQVLWSVPIAVLCISGWLSVRNRQCLYKQDATSHTKCIFLLVIPIHLNREMASVYSSFSYSSLTTNLKYTVYCLATYLHSKWAGLWLGKPNGPEKYWGDVMVKMPLMLYWYGISKGKICPLHSFLGAEEVGWRPYRCFIALFELLVRPLEVKHSWYRGRV